MVIRQDNAIEKNISVDHLRTPGDIRQFLLDTWAQEFPKQKYRYFVGTVNNGKKIYLERPGRLNKGCDFVIYVEDLILYKNGNDKPPSHKILRDNLADKKNILDSQCWAHLISAVEAEHAMRIYDVPPNCLREINNIGIMNVEVILSLCKWFFIEQDLTYWSGKGRDMLLEWIQSI